MARSDLRAGCDIIRTEVSVCDWRNLGCRHSGVAGGLAGERGGCVDEIISTFSDPQRARFVLRSGYQLTRGMDKIAAWLKTAPLN